jgi:CheY-like chemotaxis protein
LARRILIIEDYPPTVEMMRLLLHTDGYEVTIALDGPVGLRKAAAELPDLILLDVMMPELDGFEVCRRLKADPRTKNIPVIIVSVKSGPENIRSGEQAGASDYVTKPFENKRLLEALANTFSGNC